MKQMHTSPVVSSSTLLLQQGRGSSGFRPVRSPRGRLRNHCACSGCVWVCYNLAKMTNMVKKTSLEDVMQVNILEAKTEFSRLVRLLETGREDSIIVARYGKPVVKMTVFKGNSTKKRIGVAKGQLKAPQDLDSSNSEISELFGIAP